MHCKTFVRSPGHFYHQRLRIAITLLWVCVLTILMAHAVIADDSLLGHWPLVDDARDNSGNARHGVIHGADPDKGVFDGRSGYVEIPSSAGLQLGKGDFSIAAHSVGAH